MMMGRRDPTDMGGLRETFLTTHWSLIEGIQSGGDRDRALIGLLLDRYWKPVYCYLRRKGCDNEQAKDLTQGFFHEVVLNRHLVDRADPSAGSRVSRGQATPAASSNPPAPPRIENPFRLIRLKRSSVR